MTGDCQALRILHVIRSANPEGGGPIEGVKQLAAAQSRLGFQSELLCLDPPGAPWLAAFPMPCHAAGPSMGTYSWSPRIVPWLKAHRRDYDVVIVNGLWQFHGLAVHTALLGSGTPYCVFPHGMLDPWFKRRYPLKHFKKMLYWFWAEFRVLRDAAAVLFTAEEERILARQSFRPYRCREVVVNHGTREPEGDPAFQRALFLKAFPELNGKRLLLFLGRLHEKKGGDLLVEAFSQLASRAPGERFCLVMAGPADNEFGRRVKALAQHLGVADRITWTGMLEGDLKWGAFRAAEAFVLPSHQENFGISVAEALACGVPVLLSDKVNTWREVNEYQAGFVEKDDLVGTVRLLERWMALTELERGSMRQNAIRCFQSQFEIGIAARRLREAVASVVSAK